MTDLLDLLLEPQVLVKLNHTSGIRDGKGALYPTMLDPSDTSRNFERFGSVGHIYWLEFACAEKGACWNRDVVRRPLRVGPRGSYTASETDRLFSARALGDTNRDLGAES